MTDLITALDEPRTAASNAYLDVQTGDIEWVPTADTDFGTDEEALSAFDDVLKAPQRWLKIEPIEPWLHVDVRRRFVDTVDDPQLRIQLAEALDQRRGAVSQFSRLLRMNPDVRDGWFAFRDQALEPAAHAWLARLGLKPMPTA